MYNHYKIITDSQSESIRIDSCSIVSAAIFATNFNKMNSIKVCVWTETFLINITVLLILTACETRPGHFIYYRFMRCPNHLGHFVKQVDLLKRKRSLKLSRY